MPYLLIQRVVLPIASMEMESGILLRNLVPHRAFKSAVVDERHSE